jgi:hypothetical protein
LPTPVGPAMKITFGFLTSWFIFELSCKFLIMRKRYAQIKQTQKINRALNDYVIYVWNNGIGLHLLTQMMPTILNRIFIFVCCFWLQGLIWLSKHCIHLYYRITNSEIRFGILPSSSCQAYSREW